MTAGKATRSKTLPGWEAWLGDNDRPAQAPRLAGDLDAILAAGPKPAEWDRSRQALQRKLQAAVPAPVYYGRIDRSPVGALWLAVSEQGLVAVEFDRPEAEFRRSLERRTRRRALRADDSTDKARSQLLDYLGGRRRSFSLAVDLSHVTTFQRRVLHAAQAVPRGQVSTYGQIARRIGKPRAARAVGQALGSNPIPIVIPCHRVLGSDGSLHGYSGAGGIRTKAWLLQLEKAQLPGLSVVP